MHMNYFGDSYDIVKKSFIAWLQIYGPWSVHPMLTESSQTEEIEAFERFIGATVLCTEVLDRDTDRGTYFSCAHTCGNLFIDPDTGLKLDKVGKSKSVKYLFVEEFQHLVHKRPESLTLVFDQSLPRGKERESLEHKMGSLRQRGIYSVGYISHACFIIGTQDEDLCHEVYKHLVANCFMPKKRLVTHP